MSTVDLTYTSLTPVAESVLYAVRSLKIFIFIVYFIWVHLL